MGAAWVPWVEAVGTVLVAEWERWPEAAPERPFEASWVQAMREEELQVIKRTQYNYSGHPEGRFFIFCTCTNTN